MFKASLADFVVLLKPAHGGDVFKSTRQMHKGGCSISSCC